MSIKTIRFSVNIFAVFFIFLFICSCRTKKDIQNKPKVAATIFPLYDITRKICGKDIEVVNVLRPGASPHTFEPSPFDIKKLQNADILFNIGHELDSWAEKIAYSVRGMRIYTVDKNINFKSLRFGTRHMHNNSDEHNKNIDPHYWLSTGNAAKIAQNIYSQVKKIDPENQEEYKKRLDDFKSEMEILHARITKKLGGLENRNLIVFHESWNYFSDEFNLNTVGVFTPSPGKEPTPKYLKNLYNKAKEYNVEVVFSEPQLSPEAVRPFVEDLGLQLKVLDPLGGVKGRDSYNELMKYNAEVIYSALR